MNAASAVLRGVAALYVDPTGPYPELVADWWGEGRDAKTYAGPWPVVAHPPCGPWGRMKFLCTKQDASCGPVAVDKVRRWGGVLEHPHGSQLFRHCQLPAPGELADGWGGRTYEVRQVAWGHRCEKPTLLYIVGAPPAFVEAGIRAGGTATHRVTNGSRGNRSLARATNKENRHTPRAFAQFLLGIALAATVPSNSTEGDSK